MLPFSRWVPPIVSTRRKIRHRIGRLGRNTAAPGTAVHYQRVARGGRRASVMFLRWKRRWLRRRQETAHSAMLVRSVWHQGTPRQQVICYLGTIRASERMVPASCCAFWQQAAQRLATLALDPATRQAIEARLVQMVPRPLGVELGQEPVGLPQAALVPTVPSAAASMGTRQALAPGRPPGGLYVRWKRRHLRRRAETAWDAVLVRSVWHQGAARQHVVAYLASIRAEYRTAPAHRAWFWARVDSRLAILGLNPTTRHTVEARLAQVVPRPTAEELQVIAAQRAALAQWAEEHVVLSHPSRAHTMATWPEDRHETLPAEGGGNR
jgi:hypothetical protein